MDPSTMRQEIGVGNGTAAAIVNGSLPISGAELAGLAGVAGVNVGLKRTRDVAGLLNELPLRAAAGQIAGAMASHAGIPGLQPGAAAAAAGLMTAASSLARSHSDGAIAQGSPPATVPLAGLQLPSPIMTSNLPALVPPAFVSSPSLGSNTFPGSAQPAATATLSACPPMQLPAPATGNGAVFLQGLGGVSTELQSLPEPSGLAVQQTTPTSITLKWESVVSLQTGPYARSLFWVIETCEALDDKYNWSENRVLPLSVCEGTVATLRPMAQYRIRVRLELRNVPGTSGLGSPWTFISASTLDVIDVPVAPPRPVVHRISSTLAEVTILAAPCLQEEGYRCAEQYRLEQFEGELTGEEVGWEVTQEVLCSCDHPKAPEIVPALEKRKVDLKEGVEYHFRVRSENSRGSSKWSDIATIQPPPSVPDVRVEGVKSMSATLVWAPPQDYGLEIQHYHVFQCKVGCESDEDSTKEAVVPAGNHDKDEATGGESGSLVYYHAQQLQPSCSYTFYVKARSEGGLSDPSNTCEVATLPLPPELPSNVTVDEIQPHSLRISWTLEDESDVNMASVCEVSWREINEEDSSEDAPGKPAWSTEQDESEQWNTKEVRSDGEMRGEYSCQISKLKADTLYAVQVRGTNGGGDGPWSPAVMQRTRVPPPKPPANFSCRDTASTSTVLFWDESKDDAYPVTSYQIRYTKVGDEEEGPWLTVCPVEGEHQTLVKCVEDLEPGQEYTFQVRSVNQHGPGRPTTKLEVNTDRDAPPPPSQPESIEVTAFSILLQWKAPERDNGAKVEGYCLQMRQRGAADWDNVSSDVTATTSQVGKCDPATIYDFRVRARNAMGWSEWSDESMMETLPPPAPDPPQATSIVSTHNSVTLSWVHHQASVNMYEVQQLRGEQWVSLIEAEKVISEQLRRHNDAADKNDRAQRQSTIAFTKDNLVGDTEYVFRVAAKNDGGQSFSGALRVSTESDSWSRALTEREQNQLKELCEMCECSECFEPLSRALYDVETLSLLSRTELGDVLERLRIFPKHRERLKRALASLPGPPSKPHKTEITSDSVTVSWDSPKDSSGADYPIIEFVIRYFVKDEADRSEELRCGMNTCYIPNLLPATEYVVKVAACNEPRGQGQWSEEAGFRTLPLGCEDEQLLDCLRKALNTTEYADKVAAQLYHEEWTLDLLKPLSAEYLRTVLSKMQVKEGAIHAIMCELRGSKS